MRGGDLAAGADAAGTEHGYVGTDRVHDLGGQHHAGDLAGVAAGLVALGDDDVDAVLDVRQRVLGGAGQRGHLDAVLVRLLDDVDRRRAERVGDQHRAVLQRDVDVRARRGVQPAEDTLATLTLRERGYAELLERLLHEADVLLGDHRLEVDRLALGGDLHRHHDVDAVRLAVGVLVEPGQRRVELLGVVEPDRAEHAEPTGTGDRGGHVLGGREGEDRVLDPEPVAEFGAHGLRLLSVRWRPWRRTRPSPAPWPWGTAPCRWRCAGSPRPA